MTAYWIGAIGDHAPGAIEGYAERASVAVAKYGGRFLSRAGRFELLEGTLAGDRVAVVEFDTMERAIDCYNSPEYQDALSYRAGKADAVFFVVEGSVP